MKHNKLLKKVFLILVLFNSLNYLFAEKILFSANSMTGKSGDTNSTTKLNGNAYIKTETMEIKADSIELSGEDYRYIIASGTVSGENTESHMEFTCETLKYDRNTKVATLEGNVNLVDTDNDVKAGAQIIEYNQESDIAILQIKITLTQKDNVCSGAYAVYHKKEQILELTGNAQIKQKEDLFRAQYITLDMDTQDITLGGNVKGTVRDSKNSDSSSNKENSQNETKIDDSEKTENDDESSDENKDSTDNNDVDAADADTADTKDGDNKSESEEKEKTDFKSDVKSEETKSTNTESKTNDSKKTSKSKKSKN